MEKLLTNFSSKPIDRSQEMYKFLMNSIKFSIMLAMLSMNSVRLVALSKVENKVLSIKTMELTILSPSLLNNFLRVSGSKEFLL